jgi:GntR family transcriptional regulator
MTIRLNPLSGTPLYVQLVEHLKHSVETGAIKAGDQLPSVRKMAEDLLINPNTVVRAYRELEHLGLVETRHGEGTFVAAGAQRLARASALVEGHAAEYVRASKELGLTQTEAVAAIKAAWRKDEGAKVA